MRAHSTEVSICEAKRAKHYNFNIWSKWWAKKMCTAKRRMNEMRSFTLFIRSFRLTTTPSTGSWVRLRHTHTNTQIRIYTLFIALSYILRFYISILFLRIPYILFDFHSFRHFQSPSWNSRHFVYKVIIKNSTPKLFWSPLIEYKEHRSGIKRKPSDREYEVTFHL